MEPVTRIDLQASGPTGYLHTKLRLPEHLVADLPDLIKGAQALNPAADAWSVVRTIWRLGCKQLRRNNERRVPIRTADLPHARVTRDEDESKSARSPTNVVRGLSPSRF
jgi:hypothetical protein